MNNINTPNISDIMLIKNKISLTFCDFVIINIHVKIEIDIFNRNPEIILRLSGDISSTLKYWENIKYCIINCRI